MTAGPQLIRSASNSLYKDLRRLVEDSTAYRKQGRIWVEGDHLCRAAVARGVAPEVVVIAESAPYEARTLAGSDVRIVELADELFSALSTLESPAKVAFLLPHASAAAIDPKVSTVVLDRVQDAGNVGSILRSASALGFRQVIAIKGTAALWSPKVLRAGMGAHFALNLIEGAGVGDVSALEIPLLATSSHEGEWLHAMHPEWPCAWVFGHEGQGVSDEISAIASRKVRIAQPGGEESLNVAAAAAICLHASAARS